MTERADSAGWVYVLLIAWAALWCGDALLGESIWFFHDLRHHHLPWRAWVAEAWTSGDPPLWAPIGHGYPLMADGQAGVLYLPNILVYRVAYLLFTDPNAAECVAVAWSVFLHHALAACGATWLARSLGRSVAASLIAGFGYGFSGFLVTHLVYLGMFEVLAWLPWLAGLAIFAVRDGGRRVWQGALCVAAVWLAGHPQLALYACYAAALLGGYEVAEQPVKRLAIGRLVSMFAIGAMLASPQLMATLELVAFGERDGGVSAEFAAIGSLPVEEVVNGFLPDLFGRDRPADVPVSYHHRAGNYVGRGVSFWEDCFYMGIPVVFLAAAAAREGRSRRWWTLLTLASLLMLGPATPIYGLSRWLPGMEYLRFPVRAGILAVLAAGQLAAMGADRLQMAVYVQPGAVRRFAGIAAGASLALYLGLAVAHAGLSARGASVRESLAARLIRPDGPDPRDATAAAARADQIVTQLATATDPTSPAVFWPVVLGLAVAAGYAWSLRSGDPQTGTRLAGGILAIDLLAFGWRFNPTTPVADVVARPAVVDAVLAAPGTFRVTTVDRRGPAALDAERLSADLGLLWGTEDVIVPSPLRISRNDAWLAATGLDLALDGSDARARLAAGRRLADLSGIRYLTAIEPLDLPDLVEVAARTVGDHTVRTYENRRAFARAFAVGCTVDAGADPLAAVLAIADLRGTAVVEGPGLDRCVPGSAGAVIATTEGPGSVRIDVDLDRPGLVVLTESYYPGWVVLVDGVVTDHVRADDLFIGIPVARGHHVIAAVYSPSHLYMAMALSSMLFGIAMARAFRGDPGE